MGFHPQIVEVWHTFDPDGRYQLPDSRSQMWDSVSVTPRISKFQIPDSGIPDFRSGFCRTVVLVLEPRTHSWFDWTSLAFGFHVFRILILSPRFQIQRPGTQLSDLRFRIDNRPGCVQKCAKYRDFASQNHDINARTALA